jgi:hypothetical protein
MLEYTVLYIIKLFISRMGPWVFLFITFFKCQLFLFNPNRVRVHFMLVVQFLHLSSSCLLSSWLICSLIATYWCGIGYGGPCRSSEFLSTFFTGCAFLAVELWTCCMVVDFWTAAESNLFVCTCKIRFAFRTPLNQSYFYLQTVLVFFPSDLLLDQIVSSPYLQNQLLWVIYMFVFRLHCCVVAIPSWFGSNYRSVLRDYNFAILLLGHSNFGHYSCM